MPGQLTTRSIAALLTQGRIKPGRHTDGDGLHLHVRADGKASWVLRYRQFGRQRDMSLGGYPTVGLADARTAAREARSLIAKGVDPLLERQRERLALAAAADVGRSFRGTAEALIASRSDAWRNAKHATQWHQTLARHAYPVFGDWPVNAVDTDAVLKVLRPVWTRTPETASRLRGRIEAVLDFASARGWRDADNPARWRGHLAQLLPSPRRIAPPQHHPALPWETVPDFVTALRQHDGTAAQALLVMILTASRSGEVRGMTWDEVDLQRHIWTIPAERMKARKMHRVPLAGPLVEVLAGLRPTSPRPGQWVFAGGRAGRPLSDMAISQLVRGMATDGLEPGEAPRWVDAAGRVVVPHGFRSSFRGWTRSAGWPDHLGEIALAHVDRDKVRAAYARDDLVEERRPMMEAWAALVMGRANARTIKAVRKRAG